MFGGNLPLNIFIRKVYVAVYLDPLPSLIILQEA